MKKYQTKAQRIDFWTEDARVQAIVGNVADGIIGIDTRGLIEMFNPAAEKLFGYRADEVIGKNVKCLAAPEYQTHHDQYLQNYLGGGPRKVIGVGREVSGLRKDGSVFPMYLSVGELKHEEFHGFVGITHDLSELHQTRNELDQARKLMQNIIDSMPSIIVGVNAEGLITHWNQIATQETGISAEQAQGRLFADCFPYLHQPMVQIDRAINQRELVTSQRVAVPRAGEVRYVDVMIYPLVTNGSSGAAVRIDDISERVRMETMMVQTEKMLSVGGLAAGMAHEINNPLGIIAQGCQNLSRRLSDQLPQNRQTAEALGLDLALLDTYMEQRGIHQFLQGIREGVERATQIVADMLTYSRRSSSSFEPTSLVELVETTLRLASHDYDLKKDYDFRRVNIVRDIQLQSDQLQCDRVAIEQVLLNLVKNAAQAMGAGMKGQEPQLILKLREEDQCLSIEVIDNGPGMDEATCKRVFEPFFTTKPVGQGTGLGLSVAYFIITEQHQGTLWVESAPGAGTRFILRLPRQGTSLETKG
ncbi:MAG: PAS domain S-box protein [Motiliproteus sp.]